MIDALLCAYIRKTEQTFSVQMMKYIRGFEMKNFDRDRLSYENEGKSAICQLYMSMNFDNWKGESYNHAYYISVFCWYIHLKTKLIPEVIH